MVYNVALIALKSRWNNCANLGLRPTLIFHVASVSQQLRSFSILKALQADLIFLLGT